MKNTNPEQTKEKEIEAEDWDISNRMGILPDDVSFTQNIGCVGGKSKKPNNSTKKPTK
ncbi:hypothetical protein [uncultured Algoriphagus sp.]|uniref:hypothetical protein n=1 Tax=uncultured Algoriphagus sp. TaxID=417365 RepID=UPI0030ECE3D1|tara:strand:+ start:13789 stop:13962 length:174 start_codon:yes stop_codon:yes gene_type:complete